MNTKTDDQGANVHEERWMSLLLAVLPLEFGTCWWVNESVWQERVSSYDEHSTRDGHPGICIREKRGLRSLQSYVPMLHGSSSQRTGFPVYGLGSSPNQITRVGHLRATHIPLKRFREKDEENEMLIQLNPRKPRLTPEESQKLRVFLRQTGIYE